MSRKRPDPCSHENCGSRRFHEGDDGFTYCHNGHQQAERGTLISEDTGEAQVIGRKTRRRDGDTDSIMSRASKSLTKSQALENYLLCVQLVLRKQIQWLVEVQKLPAELETLVRDLWTLRLQTIQSKDMQSHESDTETEGGRSSSQVFSSQGEDDGNSTDATQYSQRRRRKKDERLGPGKSTPGLTDALVLGYIGFLLLRSPVTVCDIQRWVNEGHLLYYSATKEIPLEMRERLRGDYQEALEPLELLQPQKLHETVYRVLETFHTDFGMAVPPINHPLLLYRWMKELALPIEVFAGAQRLARLLNMDFTFTFDEAKRKRQYIAISYPEARLMAVLLVTTKLIFPFDKIERYPRSQTNLAAMKLDWSRWEEIQEEEEKAEGVTAGDQLPFDQAFLFNESDCMSASNERLDEYLDWCEENVASEDLRSRGRASREKGFRRMLFDFFPLESESREPDLRKEQQAVRDDDDASGRKVRQVQSSALHPRRVIEPAEEKDGSINRPGSFYKRFRTVDDLSGPSKTLFTRAAQLAGLPLTGLVEAVFWVEVKMWKREEILRRAES